MSPTPHLRFVMRRHAYPVLRNERILQQLWREHHIQPGETQPREEWRDVAVVEEEKK